MIGRRFPTGPELGDCASKHRKSVISSGRILAINMDAMTRGESFPGEPEPVRTGFLLFKVVKEELQGREAAWTIEARQAGTLTG